MSSCTPHPVLSAIFASGIAAFAASAAPVEPMPRSVKTFPVSDAASVVRDADFVMRWDAQTKGHARSMTSEGSLQVLARLDVGRWAGQRGRIYMRMPPVDLPGLLVRWSARGPLLSGQVLPGQRTLVFDGVIPQREIQDLMAVTFSADGRHLTSPRRVTFTFEIDVES